jgi:hypothetical protein
MSHTHKSTEFHRNVQFAKLQKAIVCVELQSSERLSAGCCLRTVPKLVRGQRPPLSTSSFSKLLVALKPTSWKQSCGGVALIATALSTVPYVIDGRKLRELDVKLLVHDVAKCGLLVDADSVLSNNLTIALLKVRRVSEEMVT